VIILGAEKQKKQNNVRVATSVTAEDRELLDKYCE